MSTAQSIPSRVGQTAFEMEPNNLHLAANSWNQHEQPRICILKVKEQHNTPVRLRVAMHEPVFSQIRYKRVLDLHVTPHGFGDNDVQHRHQMRHLFRFRTSHKRHVARELLKKIIDGQFVLCRLQHPLAQYTQMMPKILRGGIHAASRHQKDFSCVWISHRGSWRKGGDVDVVSIGGIRTCDHAFMTWYRNSVRRISLCLFWRHSCSALYDDSGSNLLLFSN